ncbi:hypothetical protein [Rhodopila sp.]|uniref:hypothetical protein n=1 Tax=Rhodopila sp. TaxID=2480087 RepID=UPI003D0F7E59
MVDPTGIDANELVSVALSPDRKRLRLRLKDQLGRTVALLLPASWLNTIQGALPRQLESGIAHPLDSWSMDRDGNGQDLILTLRTPEGLAVSFTAKPWQVEGMATLATYGNLSRTHVKTVH